MNTSSAETDSKATYRLTGTAVRRIGLIGCGRIGRMHAELLASLDGWELVAVADQVAEAAQLAAQSTGAQVRTIDAIIEAKDLDTVAICSSTDTHADLIVAAARAGKAIFCEKPVSLDLAEVRRATDAVVAAGVPFMIGFNRRFDPGHRSVRARIAGGAAGELHLVRITSRDPAPPPPEYVAGSGGMFMDMVIHDFDMAGYLVGSPVKEVYAVGAVRVDPRIGEAGDIDTAVTVLTHEDGTITTIDNSREAVYGYDQRVEAFGSRGMAVSDNPPRHAGWLLTRDGASSEPLQWFFLQRYQESYREEWLAFHQALVTGTDSPAGVEAALASTAVALAAGESLRTGRPVAVRSGPEVKLPIERIAGAPISWGLCEVPGWGYQLGPERVLGEMAALGLRATEFGPPGFLEVDAAARVRQLAAYGMRAVGGFHVALLHDPGHDPLPAVDAFIDECLAAQAGVVVLAAHTGSDGYDSRPALDDAGWTVLLSNLDRLSDHARARGVEAVLHPHIGTMIENDAEVRRVLAGSRVGLCVDTGHLAAAGADPVAITRDHPERVRHVHLKDVDQALAAQVSQGTLPFGEAVRAGMFVPLGRGGVDIAAMVRTLEGSGYRGWYVLEQDVMLPGEPAGSGPVDEVRICLEYLTGSSA